MPTEIEAVLNLLESLHGKSQVQAFLQARDVAYSGTWGDVRTRLRKEARKGSVDTQGLVNLLEEIEEHGNQYVFLYDIDPTKAEQALTATSISKALTQEERRSVLNTVKVVENPPDKAVLVSVRLDHNPVKLKWVQKRLLHRHIGETIRGHRLT